MRRQPNMMRVKGDGVMIQVAEWPGKGKTVLAVHGITANCRSFDVMASAVSPRHRVLAMDLRGRGLSEKPATGYSLSHHCRDMEAILTDLGLKKVVLLGHSLGAYIGLAFAAERPDRVQGLILVDGGAHLPPAQWAKIAQAIKPSTERLSLTFSSFDAYLDHIKQALYLKPWTQSMEDYFRYESETVEGRVRSRIRPETIQEESANLLSVDFRSYPPKVRCPVLILRATQGMLSSDDLVLTQDSVTELQKALPQSTVKDVEGTNHYTMIFQPHEVRDKAVLDFLEE